MVAVPAGYHEIELLNARCTGIWRRPGPTVRCR